MRARTYFAKDFYEPCYGFLDEEGCHCNLFDGEPERVLMDVSDLKTDLEFARLQAFDDEGGAYAYLDACRTDIRLPAAVRDGLASWSVTKLTEEFFDSLPMDFMVTEFLTFA